MQIYWPQKRNVRFKFRSVYSKRMQLFYSSIFFNNVDHFAKFCTKQKSIWGSLAPITTPQAPVPKFWKSQNQFLVCPPPSLTVAIHPCLRHTAELLWVPGVFLAVTTAGINLSRKSDVTKRRKRPCIVTSRRYLVGRSVWTPVALNISQRCLFVWYVFSNCQSACSMPKSR